MSQSIRARAASLIERIRAGFGRRAAGIFLALLVEGLLTLALLTLAPPINSQHEGTEMTVFSFDAEPVPEEAPTPPEQSAAEPQPAKPPKEKPPEPVETPPQPVTPPPPLIELSRSQFATADIAALPARPAPSAPAHKPMTGPPDIGSSSGDTPRVEGTGPNGEPLYAASWYRKPYDDELRGYLSTASGPGWALIACRTVPNFRVEDCVAIDEWPERSNMARAVLAAAWQFRVRPPIFRGQPKVGEWVRIRIDYELRRSSALARPD